MNTTRDGNSPKRRKITRSNRIAATDITAVRQSARVPTSGAPVTRRTKTKRGCHRNSATLQGRVPQQRTIKAEARTSEPLLRVDTQTTQDNAHQPKGYYCAETDHCWMQLEKQEGLGPWYPEFSKIHLGGNCFRTLEEARVLAVKRYFLFAKEQGVKARTVHMAAHNLGRILTTKNWKHIIAEGGDGEGQRVLIDCMVVAWRTSVKWNEGPVVASNATDICSMNEWLELGYPNLDRCTEKRNDLEKRFVKQEGLFLAAVGGLVWSPSSLDFLDRFLKIGAWPTKLVEDGGCRQLGHMLISMTYFASYDFGGVVPSHLAAAALALSVKIVNVDNRTPFSGEDAQFEYLPKCVETYVEATYDALKPVVRALAKLLRCKPESAVVLDAWYPQWASTNWQ